MSVLVLIMSDSDCIAGVYAGNDGVAEWHEVPNIRDGDSRSEAAMKRVLSLCRPGEVCVRVLLSGICGTDLHMLLHGYASSRERIVLGHEFVAQIVAPAVAEHSTLPEGLEVGSRVVAHINDVCSSCRMCLGARSHHCLRRRVIGIRHSNGASYKKLVM